MVLAHDITKEERTRDVKINQDITFETMLLAPNTLQGLKDAGFYKPSPVQLYGIPIGKCGFDLLLEAKSGTGKTAVFSIIALETIDFQKGLQVVILTPTREIAAQISDVLNEIGSRYKDLRIAVVMGGLPFQEDVEKFKKTVHIVVGSPGRLKHLIQNKNINTTAVRLLVLDEADKLLDKSFQNDIKFIHTVLPKQKQVIMSSATYSDSTKTFINDYMQNANHVCPDTDSILLGIKQKVTFVKYNTNIVRLTQDRFKELLKILAQIQFKQCLIFCNYQARVSEVHKLLKKEKWPSEMLSGQQEQVDRLDALKTLQQYKCRILVSTDLASRGIDASNIDLIVNFEPPYEWQTYLHRIGRAGRFGSYGVAITILADGKETQNFKNMFKSMELFINMHYLWTNMEFSLDNSATPAEPSASTLNNLESVDLCKENHKNMWEILNKNTSTLNSIESFDNLFKSQKDEQNPEIESFANLMVSMHDQISENIEEKPVFKHIEVKTLEPARLLPAEKCMASQDTTCNNNKNIKKPRELRDSQVQIFDKPKKGKNNESDASVKLDNDAIDVNDNYLKSENSLSNEKKALQSRHSPTYATTKYEINSNSGNKKSKDSYSTKYAKITESDGDYLSDNSYYHTESKLKKSDKKNTTYKGKKIMYDMEYKYKTNNSDSSIKYDESIQNFSNPDNEKNRSINRKNREKLYGNWYNQLKIRMQCIEQAIYIDEMSRL